jgi:DNA/RNA endonuclease G (NUC1)
MHKERRLALFTASNLDYSAEVRMPEPGKKLTRKNLGGLGRSDTEKWFSDPRIPAIYQIPDRFFTKDHGAFDKGHLVRREDVAWGHSFDEAQLANGDTFHTTNCSPQVGKFNRPDQKSNWGELEKYVTKQADTGQLCVFAGPVLSDDDKVFVGVDDEGEVRVRIPSQYWKVIVAAEKGKLQSYAFLSRQDLSDVPLEFAVSPKWRQHMVSVSDLEEMLGPLKFPAAIRNVDQARTARGESMRLSANIEMVSARLQRADVAPKGAPDLGARAALAEGPITFRDPFVSLYQSAVDDIARKIAAEKDASAESPSSNQASELVLAAQEIALLQIGPQASSRPGATVAGKESMLEGMSVTEHARACASLGWQYMQAKVFGDTLTAERLEGELDAGTCDPRWAQTIQEYVKYFGAAGTRVQPHYVTPAQAGNKVIVIKKDAKVGLIGDWGTGAAPAQSVLQQLKQQNPDLLVHLGDIYYSGTEEECVSNFEAVPSQDWLELRVA